MGSAVLKLFLGTFCLCFFLGFRRGCWYEVVYFWLGFVFLEGGLGCYEVDKSCFFKVVVVFRKGQVVGDKRVIIYCVRVSQRFRVGEDWLEGIKKFKIFYEFFLIFWGGLGKRYNVGILSGGWWVFRGLFCFIFFSSIFVRIFRFLNFIRR